MDYMNNAVGAKTPFAEGMEPKWEARIERIRKGISNIESRLQPILMPEFPTETAKSPSEESHLINELDMVARYVEVLENRINF